MQKILVPLAALAALGFLGYKAMYGKSTTTVTDPNANGAAYEESAPKQQLDNVRTKAKSIEANDQAYTDKIGEETKSP